MLSRLGKEILAALQKRGPDVLMRDILISVNGTRAEVAGVIVALRELGMVDRKDPEPEFWLAVRWTLTNKGELRLAQEGT